MITVIDMTTEISARLMIANNSTQFSAARILKTVQDAYLWAGSLFFWPSLSRSRIFSTTPNTQSLNYDYYDYPVDFLTNSVSRLYIANKKYEKKSFQSFLDYVDQSIDGSTPPDANKRYFAEFGRQFFVWPKASSAGTNDGLVWGNIQPLMISNPTDQTIFSLWDDSGNEAIIKKAMSVLMERVDSGFAGEQKQEAVQLLTLIWTKIVTELQRSTQLNRPFLSTYDYYGNQFGTSSIGNFNGIDVVS